MKTGVKILDCTLRDGGYRTNWHFPDEVVENYLKTMEISDIQIIEPGFRLLNTNPELGKFAHCSDELLERLPFSKNTQISVMIKADELLTSSDLQKSIDNLFSKAENSPVDLVRIAVPYQNTAKCSKILEILKIKGYKTSLNLTKINLKDEFGFSKAVKRIKNWQLVDILYFADTFGEFYAKDTEKVINLIRQEFQGILGFHGHNNKNLALKNSMVAINNGVKYIDSTLAGMGKGAGNLETEVLLRNLTV